MATVYQKDFFFFGQCPCPDCASAEGMDPEEHHLCVGQGWTGSRDQGELADCRETLGNSDCTEGESRGLTVYREPNMVAKSLSRHEV